MIDRYQLLIEKLVNENILTDELVIKAMKLTQRRHYLLPRHRSFESIDSPLPIGQEQTTSQPLVIAFMLSLLKARPGNKILEIGYGSGWQTGILARIIGMSRAEQDSSEDTAQNTQEKQTLLQEGSIYTYEIRKELADFGKKNLHRDLPPELLPLIHFFNEDYEKSYYYHRPFDRIISGAAFNEIPHKLIKALKTGGIMVYPTHENDIRTIIKTSKDSFDEDIYPGYTFVPIVHKT